MSDDSEEKTLQPTAHKLREARKKGQVSTSQDFVTAAVTIAALLWLVFAWPGIVSTIDRIFSASLGAASASSRDKLLPMFYATFHEMGVLLTPLFVLVTLVAIGANILHKQGIPFSLHPITPDFSRINPAQLFKKLFSRRNATEFAISFLRLVAWFVVTGIIAWFAAGDILAGTLCKDACSLNSAMSILTILLSTVVVMLAVAALLDLPLQSFLFKDEQKMGHKEMKRELKDTMGNPEIRAHRRGTYQTMLNKPTGAGDATLVLSGPGLAVAIRYNPTDSPVPTVVARYGAADLREALVEARKKNVPVIEEPSLASDIHRSVAPGAAIRERHFARVAQALVQAGAL